MSDEIIYISKEEFDKLYIGATDDKELQLAMDLGFWSGLRISEIIGLYEEMSPCCKAKINKKKIRVEGFEKKQMERKCSKCDKILPKGFYQRKYGEWKILPLQSDKINLETHQIRLSNTKGNKWRITVAPINLTEERLKLLPIKMPRRTLQNKFTELTEKILGRHLQFHSLRHGFANYQANVIGTPLPIVQALLGHAQLSTTGIYTRANPVEAIRIAWGGMNKK